MAKHQFTSAERHAIFTVNGGVCYVCATPVTMKTFEVDHVLPEHLANKAEQLSAALTELGLPDDFDVNSYENWAPCCGDCNRKKLDMVWNPSLLVQRVLQRLELRAPQAREHAAKVVSSQKMARALNILEAADEQDSLTPDIREALRPLVEDFAEHQPQDIDVDSVRVTPTYTAPLYEVLGDDGMTMTVKGPYGVGGGPSAPAPSAMCCGVCGYRFFSGARCVICGTMDDD